MQYLPDKNGMSMGIGSIFFANKKIRMLEEKRDVDGLINELHDPDGLVRVYAVYALQKIGDRRATEPLCRCLMDKSNEVRWTAAATLGQFGDPIAVKSLLWALDDPDKTVRVNSDNAIKSMSMNAIDYLIIAMGEKDNRVVQHAFNYIIRFGERAFTHLIDALKNPNRDVRSNAAFTLGYLKDVRAVEPLINLLNDSDCYVRIQAINSLKDLNDIRAIEPIMKALKDDNPEVRNTAAIALKKYNVQSITKEKETIYKVVKIPCKYCGTLIENTSQYCPSCGAPLNPFK